VTPTYRAKGKYRNDVFRGNLVKDSIDEAYYLINWFRGQAREQDNGYVEIDIETLEISFDGKNFYKIKEVSARVDYCEKLTETTH